MPNYTVQQGDCINSIAVQFGFAPDTIWNHGQNAALKATRKDLNVLFPGDVVFTPDKTIKQPDAAHDQTHSFTLKGVPAKLRLRMMRNDKPQSNERYVLEIDGKTVEGSTDGDGWIVQPIQPDAKQGKLTFPDSGETHDLMLGQLDPIDQVSGVQSRLRSLGFYGGEVSGTMDDATQAAIAAFQTSKNLNVTGTMDSATQSALKAAYGS